MRRSPVECGTTERSGAHPADAVAARLDVLPNWDGFRFALRATMEYYFLHNVAWYADPDVLVVRPPLPLEPAAAYRFPVKEPQQPWAERAGVDGVNLRWNIQHQPAAGYLVTLNGVPLGFTPTQVFALKNLDPDGAYAAEVRTVWQDGTVSQKAAQLKFTLKQMLPRELALSELEPLRLTNGWRQPELNRTFTGRGLSLKGQPYASGVGMPTNSEIEFEVKAAYDTFTALAGVDDEYTNAEGGVEFAAIGDGRELWHSGAVKRADGPVPVKVNVKGVQRLMLRVKRAGGEGGRIHADWVDAKLVR